MDERLRALRMLGQFGCIHLVMYGVVGSGEHLRPAMRGLMGICSVVRLVQAGVGRMVVITGVQVVDPESGMTCSELYARELRWRLAKVGRSIIILPESLVLRIQKTKSGSKDTTGEVMFMLEQ